jgi:hypothetical protein
VHFGIYIGFGIVIGGFLVMMLDMTRRKRDREYSRRPEERIADTLEEIEIILFDGLRLLEKRLPVPLQHIKLAIRTEKGESFMPVQLPVGKTATAVAHRFSDATETPLKGAAVYSTSDATIATVDPASGLITAVAAGTATITGTDIDGLAGSDTVTDQAVPVETIQLVITLN